MSANRIFLVCNHCQSIEESLLLAERQTASDQYLTPNLKRADDWFAKHLKCGVDCFSLAYHRPKDWDRPTLITDAVSDSLRMDA